MELKTIGIIGFLFCIIGIFITPLLYENLSFYEVFILLIMYFIPALILSILNAYFLHFLELKLNGLMLNVAIALLPLILLILLTLADSPLSPLQYIATFGIIGIGVTNIIWIILKVKGYSSENNY